MLGSVCVCVCVCGNLLLYTHVTFFSPFWGGWWGLGAGHVVAVQDVDVVAGGQPDLHWKYDCVCVCVKVVRPYGPFGLYNNIIIINKWCIIKDLKGFRIPCTLTQ